MRTGLIDLDGLKVKYIGDVHLGRRFLNGVPLHRRGEREKMVLEQFWAELDDDADIIVQVGDIFDRFTVPYETIMWSYSAIRTEAQRHPTVRYVILRGNHDAQRDLEKVSAFDILREMCRGAHNIEFVTDEPLMIGGRVGFVPWHPVKSAAELASELRGPLKAVFGHWDLESYGGDTHNLIPLEQLQTITPLAVTGHDHLPREIDHPGFLSKIIVTGSMQPYAHGEEPEPKLGEELPMYLTMTLDDLGTWMPEELKDKCVRILLQPGESLPVDLDCLQLTGKRVGTGEELTVDVDLDAEFDMDALFTQAFTAEGVDPAITAELTAKFKELRHA